MPKILITQEEVNNHSNLPALLNDFMTFNCNEVACLYASISQNNLDNYSIGWDADAWEIVVLPKEVVEG